MAKAATLKSRTADVRKSKPRNRNPRKASTSKPATAYDLESWLAGYNAGLCRHTIEPPKTIPTISRGVPGAIGLPDKSPCERASWLAGYVEGAGQNHTRIVMNNTLFHGGDGCNRSDYCGIGSVGYTSGFMQGMRMAVRQSWRGITV